jgi:hypothetical protein
VLPWLDPRHSQISKGLRTNFRPKAEIGFRDSDVFGVIKKSHSLRKMRVHKIQKHNYKSVIAFCTFPPFRVIRENTKISLVSERYPTASKVVENLKTVPIGILPSNEAQVRPLTNLEPEQQIARSQSLRFGGQSSSASPSLIPPTSTDLSPTKNWLEKRFSTIVTRSSWPANAG